MEGERGVEDAEPAREVGLEAAWDFDKGVGLALDSGADPARDIGTEPALEPALDRDTDPARDTVSGTEPEADTDADAERDLERVTTDNPTGSYVLTKGPSPSANSVGVTSLTPPSRTGSAIGGGTSSGSGENMPVEASIMSAMLKSPSSSPPVSSTLTLPVSVPPNTSPSFSTLSARGVPCSPSASSKIPNTGARLTLAF